MNSETNLTKAGRLLQELMDALAVADHDGEGPATSNCPP